MSLLFAIWSTVGFVAEVPSGALADRFSRRGALVVSGLAQAVGFGVWIALPGFAGFAAGFVLWGLGGTLASGAFEALLYDGLAAVDAEEHYARINGRAVAAGLVAQVPAALGATVLFTAGGYAAAGWVSVGLCVAAALAGTFALGLVMLGVAGIGAHPAGLVAVTAFYGLYRMVSVVADARLQDRIAGSARATVTSVAALGTEIVCFAVYGTWALGGLVPIAAAWLVVAAALPWLLTTATAERSAASG